MIFPAWRNANDRIDGSRRDSCGELITQAGDKLH
jgi:hypothetical protein